jgi:hypothetical protein
MTDLLTKERPDAAEAMIRFHAQGVTGADSIEVQFQRTTPGEAVARSLADMLGMPEDTSYGLRNDGTSAYLEDRAIGEQIEPGARLTVVPKTHLGFRG